MKKKGIRLPSVLWRILPSGSLPHHFLIRTSKQGCTLFYFFPKPSPSFLLHSCLPPLCAESFLPSITHLYCSIGGVKPASYPTNWSSSSPPFAFFLPFSPRCHLPQPPSTPSPHPGHRRAFEQHINHHVQFCSSTTSPAPRTTREGDARWGGTSTS